MPDITPNSHQPPEDHFLAWVDVLVDPTGAIPVPDPDLAELAGTAAFVQRAAGPGSAPSLSPNRTDSMWEEIMNAVPISAQPTPTQLASNGAKPIAPRTIPSVPPTNWRTWLPTALLIAALVIGGAATIWRVAGPFDLGRGGNDYSQREMEFAAVATPGVSSPAVLEAQEFGTPQPAATPASPVAEAAPCDLGADIPVVTDPDVDLPGTVLLLDGGTLSLTCDDATTVVAEDVASVIPGTTWPGAVVLQITDGSVRGANLRTGAIGDLGTFHDEVPQWMPFSRVTRWLVFPTTPEQLDWRIVDLETMDSLLLSDELGGVLPRSTVAHLWATTPDAAVVGFGGIPIIPGQANSGPDGLGGATPAPGTPTAELPSEWSALVFDGSLENRRWIETSRSVLPTSAVISPDGQLLAYTVPTDDGFTVRVERLSDGTLVADTDIELASNDTMLLVNDGLLHLTPDRLDLVTWDDTGEVTVEALISFDAPPANVVLVQTADPNIVIAGTIGPDGARVGQIIDTTSGQITDVPGMLQMPFVMAQYSDGVPVGYVLAAAPASDPAQSIVHLIDITSGEPVATSEALDLAPTELATQEAALRDGSGFVFLKDGRTVLLDAETGEATIIAPPGDPIEGGWFTSLSPSGDELATFSKSSGHAYLRGMAPDADWTEVAPDSFVTFVPGAS
jgi:hypothetical protein